MKNTSHYNDFSLEEKRVLLAQLLKEKASAPKFFPLSFAQQRLWYLNQLELDSTRYNIPAAVHLSGELNKTALEQSLNEIIRRHEALRTNFTTAEDQPVQVISSNLTLAVPVVDLQSLHKSEQQEQVQQLAIAETQHIFDLAQDVLVRAVLLQLGAKEYVLLLTMHHIVSDGWSMGILVRELTALYEAYGQNLPLPLCEIPIQYADFAVWQRQWLQGETLDSLLAYWKQQLANAPALLELPTDRPRPAIQTFQGAHQVFRLSKDLSEALTNLSQQEGVTLFMTLLAAFQILLSRYSGQTDILVGSPIANRNRAEIEGLIGFFVNTLVLRTNLDGNPSFQQLLGRVRKVALEAYAHQDLPFEQLVEKLQPVREPSYTPLFQVVFVLQNAPLEALELPGLTLSPLEVEDGTAKFDLTLFMNSTEQGLIGTWEYNTNLFDSTTIQRMVGHFQTLLKSIVFDPTQEISKLSILTPAEQNQLLVEWNNTHVDYPKNICIHQLFEAQVERTPDATAIVFENQQLTYRELNCRANQLAHHLSLLGVKPNIPVAICMELCLDVAVGILGILKAGGILVPLEPNSPKDRLAFILEDTQVPILLTQHKLLNELPQHQAYVVCIDTSWQAIAQESTENAVNGVNPKNLAYILYTSGSTGKPKGVMLSHFVCCTRELLEQRIYPMRETDSILLKSSWSSKELFWPLLAGSRAVMIRQGGYQDTTYLVELISQQGITVISVVPSVLQLLLEEPKINNCSSLRHIFCVGEAMPVGVQESFFKKGLSANLYNLYGLNEANYATLWQCQPHDNKRFVSIGRPTDMQVYLLNQYLQPTPIGVKGEIYISGVGLADGYLNRPELTAERFIPNPFSNETGGRLYKTGDLARYLPDGTIEYLGRVDHQVKIRGNRIELGEIEAVLRQHPAVEESVVIIREEVPGDKRLVAYVTLDEELLSTVDKLRPFLRQQLPDYMVPSVFIVLKDLPRTFNGKINRLELPVPKQTFIAPRNSVEQHLADIWTQVLGLKQVGIYNSFFELGGHSLMATQVISRLREIFQVELSVQDLFEVPTIAELSERVETLQWTVGQSQKMYSNENAARSPEESFIEREEFYL